MAVTFLIDVVLVTHFLGGVFKYYSVLFEMLMQMLHFWPQMDFSLGSWERRVRLDGPGVFCGPL